jgi:cyclase
MFRPRVIPTLLLSNNGLVKSEKFANHRYIGDPINAVHLFNELKVDELCFLDINATREKRLVDLELLKRIADEANMPFGAGGGIRTLDDIKEILRVGAEKVVISTFAIESPDFITQAAYEFGSSTISICIDVKRKLLGKYGMFIHNGGRSLDLNPVDFARKIEDFGAGEIIVNSIDRDGTMEGYDVSIIRSISESVTIPVVALGGAGSMEDFKKAIEEGAASAVAAGSFFIFKGKRRAVLINYPGSESFDSLFNNSGV